MTQSQAGTQEHSQSNAKALGAALRINTRAGVTCPHLPDCKRGEDSAGTLEKLCFWHGDSGWLRSPAWSSAGAVPGLTAQLSQPDWEPAGKNNLKSCTLTPTALPRLHRWLSFPSCSGQHPHISILLCQRTGAKMGMDPSRLVPVLPNLPFTLP